MRWRGQPIRIEINLVGKRHKILNLIYQFQVELMNSRCVGALTIVLNIRFDGNKLSIIGLILPFSIKGFFCVVSIESRCIVQKFPFEKPAKNQNLKNPKRIPLKNLSSRNPTKNPERNRGKQPRKDLEKGLQ